MKWEWPEATGGQRLMAYVVDTAVMGSLSALVGAVAAWVPGLEAYRDLLSSFVMFLYWPLLHIKNDGQTIGKKIIGIRVVDMTGEPPSVRQVWTREIWGRLVAALFLVGYIRILWRKDRRGLHDTIGGTHVIALQEAKEINFAQVFAGFAAFLVAAGGGFYYALNYTSFPLRALAKALEPRGCKMDGIGGSLKSGFRVGDLSFDTEMARVEIKDIHFDGDLTRQTGGKGNVLKVKKVSIGNLRVEAHHDLEKMQSGLSANQLIAIVLGGGNARKEKVSVSLPPKRENQEPLEVVIDEFNVARFELRTKDQKSYFIQRLYVSGLNAKPKIGEMKVGRVYMTSDYVELSLQGMQLSVHDGLLDFRDSAYVLIKPEFRPDLLRNSIDFQIEITVKDSRVTVATLSALRGKVRGNKTEGSLKLNLSSLNLTDFFKTGLPVRNLNLEIERAEKTPGSGESLQAKGYFDLESRRFNLNQGVFVTQDGDRFFAVIPRLEKWREVLDGKAKAFVLTSSRQDSARESLAQIYFGKAVSQLDQNQSARLDFDGRYFADLSEALANNGAKGADRAPSATGEAH